MLPLWAWLILGAANAVAFVMAVVDKSRARRGQRRVPERTFHLLALLGGWPGALLAFALARHKIRKVRFLAPFLLCAGLNLAGVAAAWILL